MKTLDIFIVIAGVFYPFTIVFKPSFTMLSLIFLATLYVLKFISAKNKMSLFLALFFAFVIYAKDFAYLYPVLVSAGMFFVFFASLKTTPMITRLASLKKNLDEKGLVYTRKLTIIWCYFFVINAVISYLLSLNDDKSFWAIYCGFISYVIIGVLFGGEILYRKFVLRV